MVELSSDQLEGILKGIKVPPQPQIMVDLQMEQAMPEPDMGHIADLISRDVGLSGSILKTVNSPFYGLANKITSVHQTVNILGMNSVVNIVNGLSIRNALSDDNVKALTRFWDSAMDIAMIATAVAKQVQYRSPDNAYALGLFHNVGIPILMAKFENYMGYMLGGYSSHIERVIDFENQQLNCNHAVVGYYTAKSWHLPKMLCDIIAQHHSSQEVFLGKKAEKNETNTLLAILKLSEHIAGLYVILGQQKVDYEWEMIESEVLEYLELNDCDLDALQTTFADMGMCPTNYGQM